MFDTTRLRVFREVVERGSFSAAAEALSFTQPAVSRQIATLEREAGAQLIERMPRGIRLTEAGRILVGHTEAILGRMAAARTQIDAVARLQAGRLRIGSFSTANATIVPRAIAGFEPLIRFGAEQWLGKQGLVAAGVGVTLIPGLAVAGAREDIVLRSLADAPTRRIVALLPEGYRAPAAEAFVELLRAEADEHCVACVERERVRAEALASA